MNTLSSTADRFPLSAHTLPVAARTVLHVLQNLKHGHLTLVLPNERVMSFGDTQQPHVQLHITNWRVFSAILKSGDIGFAEGFIEGDWHTSDLPELMRLVLRNRAAVEQLIHGSWAGRLIYRMKHWLNRNTKANSQKNIHQHYDLGNDFYRLWLDPCMNYSSAISTPLHGEDMTQAQQAKVQRALEAVGLKTDDRLLEIGCGWGALAEQAIEHFQAHVTGVTLSSEQLKWTHDRLSSIAKADQFDIRLQDYRDIKDAPFDAICSIEMLEAVGQTYWPTYFGTIQRLLKPQGKACIQTIVIQDSLFDRYIRSTDFIQQYIFPGGCLPSPSQFKKVAQDAGLKVVDEHRFGADYANTLRYWRRNFESQREAILSQGFDERFMRIWTFYLAYCEAGFDAGDIDVMQFTLEK